MAKAVKKQYTTAACFVCGEQNPKGLKMNFYQTENNEVVGLFDADQNYGSYRNVLHGGISAAILDETIGRAIMITDPEVLGMTVELNIKYLKPAPCNGLVKAVGRITKRGSRSFEGEGEILLPDGTPCVKAKGLYVIVKEEQSKKLIVDGDSFNYHELDRKEV